ncbi:hypothetical protein [Streptomyces sp. ISL-94]|uniref:hypothetical protein n=1 Tax=Streptomyces sp. ISL-94 TaxID=2819190 RepID=UPI001BEA4F63|nr:hypothetical protein [Streptomyces sp. ISL-94]MBT2480597.1 hypothetical protein [Streptomyces sp. ISL-94]
MTDKTNQSKKTKARIASAGGRWSRHAAGRGVALALAMIPVLVEALPPWLLIVGIAALVVAAGQNGQPGSAPEHVRNGVDAGPSRAGRPVPRRVHHRVRAPRRGGPAGWDRR